MAQLPSQYPFAFSVAKIDYVWSVRPTLAEAVASARDRFSSPNVGVEIKAWFPDGTDNPVAEALLRTPEGDWISPDRCRELQAELFGSHTVREQATSLLRSNEGADYWEKLVLRLAEGLLAHVDEQLRGISVDDAGIEKMTLDDFDNLPEGAIELHDGIPSAKRWKLFIEGRRRLGFASISDEEQLLFRMSHEEVEAEYARRREELRLRPFVPSHIPFPSGPPEE